MVTEDSDKAVKAQKTLDLFHETSVTNKTRVILFHVDNSGLAESFKHCMSGCSLLRQWEPVREPIIILGSIQRDMKPVCVLSSLPL